MLLWRDHLPEPSEPSEVTIRRMKHGAAFDSQRPAAVHRGSRTWGLTP
jgi:hypothetical protein